MKNEKAIFLLTIFITIVFLIGLVCMYSLEQDKLEFNRETCEEISIWVHDGDVKEYDLHCDPFPHDAMNGKIIRCDVLVSNNEIWCLYDEGEE